MWIPELGRYYYKARMYSPTLGRFMQTDPIGYSGGMNLYNYVRSDPVNFVDPLGLFQVCYNVPAGVGTANGVARQLGMYVDWWRGGGNGEGDHAE